MAIETLAEWNDRITSFDTAGCCDCKIPGQDDIAYISENLLGFVAAQGWSHLGDLYRTRLVSWSNGGTSTQTYDSEYACQLGGTVIEPLGAITTVNVPPLSGVPTTTYNTPINIPDALAAGRAAVEGAVDWVSMYKTAGTIGSYESVGFDTSREISFARVKFRKSDFSLSNPPGNYLKLTFDVVDYPESGSPAFFAEDEVLVWTGDFDVDDQTNPAHFTDFYYIDPPPGEGTREIKNMRFTRFQTTRYGNKPQTSDDFGTFP